MNSRRTIPTEPSQARDELQYLVANAEWLLPMRWVAVVGQLLTIGIVAGVFGVTLPWLWLIVGVALTAISNLLCAIWRQRLDPSDDGPQAARRVRRLLGTVMGFDIVSLTFLLSLAGGIANPFAVFYLVNLTLCAVVLSERWAWGLTGMALAGMSLLLAWHVRVPELSTLVWTSPRSWLPDLTLGQLGQVVAMAACALVIIHFVARVTRQLELTAEELRRVERERSRSEKLEALGTLAGGAAHELATPLSTIAVVAKEMIHFLHTAEVPETVRDDMSLIRTEVAHCQAILQRMTGRAGQWMTERQVTIGLPELLRETLAELSQADRVQLTIAPAAADATLKVPQESFAQALRGLIQNGLDASERSLPVQLHADGDEQTIRLTIQDHGPGMSREVLERAGEPFFTTKEPGRGMGLGLFLTRTVIERLGGRLSLESPAGSGVTATVELPRQTRRNRSVHPPRSHRQE